MDRYQTPLFAELVVIQSHPTNHYRDILQVGFMDDNQFKQYVKEQRELIRDRHYQYRD